MEHFDGAPLRHFGDVPAMAAHRYGERTAFTSFGQATSYADLERESSKYANMLADHGVEPGDRVGIFVPNTAQFPICYFGIIKAGGVAVPLNLRMDPETLVYVVNNAEADHIVGSPLLAEEVQNLADAAEVGTLFLPGVSDGAVNISHVLDDYDDELEMPEREYSDIACQPYTSGTTGRPKGVLLSHENLLTTVEAYTKGGLAIDADDSIVLVLPLFHIFGLNAIMGTYLIRGATMHLQPQPEGEGMLNGIQEHEATTFAGVPAMYTMMWREYRENPEQYDLSSLRYVNCAAAPLADEVRRTIEEAWDVPMVEGWGMTETAPAGTVEPSHGVRKEAGCIGPALECCEIKIVDPESRETRVSPEKLSPFPDPDLDFDDVEATGGELAIRGPNVFEGYFKLPEKTEAAFDDEGYFYTEDIARVDDDGYFWMVDRADDMIIAGGENIYPAEVEAALYEHPDVEEAGVCGAPHEVKGMAPVAFVVLMEGTEMTEEELRKFTLDHVASYAHPRRIFFVDELPRSATQKVQRYRLEEMAEEMLDGPLTSGDQL
jgi:long-chain acyl-CoA synthetase